ncbi:uncharacterized protein CTRU02_211100 [Colletotrichum truncatum]|uniref:Uncharacterized protein n=1 Tax=Colletotrichum truncatum TaxID=5467 RepID=A0ACC3YR07_COLTU|nr:uncharacterized protein CTRU02_01879 [Colletotrichum truncatum]KAF6799008.1 hypothetical protein CTRU02_01879 [Colletotrichum truncatum]
MPLPAVLPLPSLLLVCPPSIRLSSLSALSSPQYSHVGALVFAAWKLPNHFPLPPRRVGTPRQLCLVLIPPNAE